MNSPNVAAALAGAGYLFDGGVTQSGINIFANGLSTRTAGGEFVVTYSSDFDAWGHVDWTASGSYNKTKVISVKGSPRQIAPQTLYDTSNDNAYVGRYPDFSPFGINGGYYYGRVTYSF